jgi:hypothetical protein
VLQNLVTLQNAQLGANLALAQGVLSPAQYRAGQSGPDIAPMFYGTAVERLARQKILADPLLRQLFNPVGIGGRGADILGVGPAQGLIFDITTSNPGTIAVHQARLYGQNLIIITYDRPAGFTVFP